MEMTGSGQRLELKTFAEGRFEDYEGILPDAFIEWQAKSRMDLADLLVAGRVGEIKSMPAHLPVLATIGDEGSINLATKGIGMLPTRNRLSRLTTMFTEALAKSHGLENSMGPRASALRLFYSDSTNFDRRLLGGLEIFEGRTYSNLRRDPKASLLYTGEPPDFPSYQIDGVAKIVGAESPYHGFLISARNLFSKERFHVPQDSYPHAILIHVTRVVDKRPFPRR